MRIRNTQSNLCILEFIRMSSSQVTYNNKLCLHQRNIKFRFMLSVGCRNAKMAVVNDPTFIICNSNERSTSVLVFDVYSTSVL